jgi:hypothetical protein
MKRGPPAPTLILAAIIMLFALACEKCRFIQDNESNFHVSTPLAETLSDAGISEAF